MHQQTINSIIIISGRIVLSVSRTSFFYFNSLICLKILKRGSGNTQYNSYAYSIATSTSTSTSASASSPTSTSTSASASSPTSSSTSASASTSTSAASSYSRPPSISTSNSTLGASTSISYSTFAEIS